MRQVSINQNVVNALSLLNKALMNMASRLVTALEIISDGDDRIQNLAELTAMDIEILDKLQANLQILKEVVKYSG